MPRPKGFKHSEETLAKMRLAKLGKKRPDMKVKGYLKGHIPWNKGVAWSPEARQRISTTNKVKGIEPKQKFVGFGENHPGWKGGKPNCLDCGVEVSYYSVKRCKPCWHRFNRGENSYNWKGGVRTEAQLIRGSIEYRQWRKAVFGRDNYTCQICFERGGILNADHIKRFSDYPELRFELSNGRTLCESCHKTTDNYAGRGLSRKRAAV